ncbi:hypothetical protein QQS21_000918 [Conoideocrella luteorostrata]|uniref:Phospholipase/carboxylesterase/thioesterase domain-containing protein n=1 Tax=Conoideocrella luteorostrata TaxID=1105319 RepID=A0AAJ0G2D5_9HYPO|nr:hypothetical protein QQS21_000918 [Conoideocrella luteorostrata]
MTHQFPKQTVAVDLKAVESANLFIMEPHHSTRIPVGKFPPPIIVPPLQSPHQHTIIFLHGRGSNASKFHGPLLNTSTGEHTFQEAFPHARFVFPTAPMSRATKYARMLIHQWFDGSGDWESDARGGMAPSIEYIQTLVQNEIEMVGGDSQRVVLAGLSQGCATTLMSMLLWERQPLGAVVGLCGYMPICSHLQSIVDEDGRRGGDDDIFERDEGLALKTPLQRVVDELREEAELAPVANPSDLRRLSTPVFLGHGRLDPQVDVQQAVHASELLDRLGVSVESHIYEGLGHWYSGEMLRHVEQFLKKHLDS